MSDGTGNRSNVVNAVASDSGHHLPSARSPADDEPGEETKHADVAPAAQPVEKPGAQPAPDAAGRTVKHGGRILAAAILISLTWYLLADRFTPYTTQARVEGNVVGVAPEVAGIVARVWVTNNEEVQKGQKLFEIDPAQYQIALNKARSDLDNARRQVAAGSAGVDAARANLQVAEANALKARQDLTRLDRLYKEDPGTISVRRLEIAQASLDGAEAQVTAAHADIRQAIEQMGGDESDNTILKAALTAVDKAELDRANTVVTASIRGVITDLRAEVGQFAGTGGPVLTLVAIQDVWISADFTENNLGNIGVGSPVEILFDAVPGHVFQGQIRSIGLGVSSGRQPSAGELPTIRNDRDWLRQAQRFPVVISFDTAQDPALKGQLRWGGRHPSSPTARGTACCGCLARPTSGSRAGCRMRTEARRT